MHAFGRYATLTPTHNLYQEVIFLSWGGRIFFNVESLMVILLSLSVASFGTPSYGVLTMKLCSSRAEFYNNNFGIKKIRVVINRYINTILFDCRLHNLRMIYNPMVIFFSELLTYFCVTTVLCNF